MDRGNMKISKKIDQYLEKLVLYRKSASSIKRYAQTRRVIQEYFGTTPVKKITLDNIQEYINSRLALAKPSTINKELIVLKKITELPISLLRVKNSRITYFNEFQIDCLLRNSTGYLHSLIFVAVNTGMRISELLNMKWTDIDFELGVIYLEESKGGGGEYVMLNTDTIQHLREYRMKSLRKDYYVYLFHGRKMARVDKGFAGLLRRCNIVGDYSFHTLRHTYGTNLMRSGVDLLVIQDLMRHKSYETTRRYLHIFDDRKKEAVNRLNRSNKKSQTATTSLAL